MLRCTVVVMLVACGSAPVVHAHLDRPPCSATTHAMHGGTLTITTCDSGRATLSWSDGAAPPIAVELDDIVLSGGPAISTDGMQSDSVVVVLTGNRTVSYRFTGTAWERGPQRHRVGVVHEVGGDAACSTDARPMTAGGVAGQVSLVSCSSGPAKLSWTGGGRAAKLDIAATTVELFGFMSEVGYDDVVVLDEHGGGTRQLVVVRCDGAAWTKLFDQEVADDEHAFEVAVDTLRYKHGVINVTTMQP